MTRRTAARIAFVLALTTGASAAFGYILPAEAILGSVARRRESLGFKSVIVEGVQRLGAHGPETPVWEAIAPGGLHRRELRGESPEVIVTAQSKRTSWREGSRPQTARIRPDPIVVFLAQTSADARLEGRALLDAYGIDADTVSLSRLDRTIAYVIGAKPWELDKPQLWIDKGFRTPLRLIELDPKTKELTDTRYTGWGAAQTGEWWPRKIEVYKNGQLVSTTTYTDVQVNEPLDPGLFKAPGS